MIWDDINSSPTSMWNPNSTTLMLAIYHIQNCVLNYQNFFFLCEKTVKNLSLIRQKASVKNYKVHYITYCECPLTKHNYQNLNTKLWNFLDPTISPSKKKKKQKSLWNFINITIYLLSSMWLTNQFHHVSVANKALTMTIVCRTGSC